MNKTTKNRIVPILACFAVFTLIPLLVSLFLVEMPASNKDTIVFIIGQVTGWAGAVYTFYFGSSSSDKTTRR